MKFLVNRIRSASKMGLACAMLLGFLVVGCSIAENSTADTGVEVLSYDECIRAGFPILKMYPPVCITPDGKKFSPPTSSTAKKICVDKCGDGVCQEIVCLAGGCPCPETGSTCSKDCGMKE